MSCFNQWWCVCVKLEFDGVGDWLTCSRGPCSWSYSSCSRSLPRACLCLTLCPYLYLCRSIHVCVRGGGLVCRSSVWYCRYVQTGLRVPMDQTARLSLLVPSLIRGGVGVGGRRRRRTETNTQPSHLNQLVKVSPVLY